MAKLLGKSQLVNPELFNLPPAILLSPSVLINSRYECERALRSKGMYDQRGRDLRVYQSSYSGYPTGCSYAQPYRDENYAKKIWGSNYKRYWAGNYNYKDYLVEDEPFCHNRYLINFYKPN